MDLERERGITIKAHPVAMRYASKSGEKYRLNLLDARTCRFLPTKFRVAGRVRRRALEYRCSPGLEAQTVANVHLAHKQGLTIVPIINKIDLPSTRTFRLCDANRGDSRDLS